MSIVIIEKLAKDIKVGDLVRDVDMISFQKVENKHNSGRQIVLWLEKNNIGGRKQGKSLVSLVTNEPVEVKEIE